MNAFDRLKRFFSVWRQETRLVREERSAAKAPTPPTQAFSPPPVGVVQPVYVVGHLQRRKSVGTGVILGLLFGPLGMFYVSGTAGAVSLIASIFLAFVAAPALVLGPVVFAVLGGVLVSNHNSRNVIPWIPSPAPVNELPPTPHDPPAIER